MLIVILVACNLIGRIQIGAEQFGTKYSSRTKTSIQILSVLKSISISNQLGKAFQIAEIGNAIKTCEHAVGLSSSVRDEHF